MEAPVKYIIKGKPTLAKKIAGRIFMIALVLLLIGDFLYTPLKSLPLELQVFVIGELIPRIFFDFHGILIMFFGVACIFYLFRWRTGTFQLLETQIKLNGKICESILFQNIRQITFFDTDLSVGGNKRMIQIKTLTGVFKLKFRGDNLFAEVAEKIVFAASRYSNITIDSSILTRPE